MRKILLMGAGSLLALMALLILWPGTVLASGNPARVDTVAAGPYVIDVTFSQDPPYTDQPLTLTIVPHDSTLSLSGQLTARPGLGVDAVNIYNTLVPVTGQRGALQGTVHIPVKGAWNLVIHLDGPQGGADVTVSTIVGAPGAMPSWLAWLIGSFPLVFIAFWILHQHRYRNKLQASQSAPA